MHNAFMTQAWRRDLENLVALLHLVFIYDDNDFLCLGGISLAADESCDEDN
jgi:hypothetical protein